MLKGGIVAQTPGTDIETGTQVQIRAFVSFCTLISALIAIHVVIEEKGWNTFIPTFNRHFIQAARIHCRMRNTQIQLLAVKLEVGKCIRDARKIGAFAITDGEFWK
jgi:hypothetical protein